MTTPGPDDPTPPHQPAAELAGLDPKDLLLAGLETVPPVTLPLQPVDPDATVRVQSQATSQPAAPQVELPMPEDLTKLLPGGNYQVESFLGQGGMGAVYKGQQVRLKRPVAIKIMRRDMGKDYDFEARFEREAQAMAKLNHPNIVSVIDYGEAGPDYLYIVMELVDGADLMEVIRGGQMTQEMALSLLPQICDALQFAHDHGIVHRDIKPSNIMLTRDGRIKMADFGLAKRYDVESSFRTQTGTGMGTPDYAAPEQFDPSANIDHRADIYALGVMIYQMITGTLPRGVWKPPSQRAAISPQWDDIVSRAMQSDPADRYQQASQVKTDVSSIPLAESGRSRQTAEVAAPAAPRPRAMTSTPAKSRTPLVLGLAVGAAVIAAGAFFALRKPNDAGNGRQTAAETPSTPNRAPAGATAASSPAAPPAVVHTFGGHRYQWVPGAISWPVAKERAETLGGHLATVTTKEEASWLAKTFGSALSSTGGAASQCWLGASTASRDQPWRWVTGEPVSFTQWQEGEPNFANGSGKTLQGPFAITLKKMAGTLGWNETMAALTDVAGFLVEWDDAESGSVHAVTAPQTTPSQADDEKLISAKAELARLEAEITQKQARWQESENIIRRLTNDRKTPIFKGSQDYPVCIFHAEICDEIIKEAPRLLARKAELKAKIKALSEPSNPSAQDGTAASSTTKDAPFINSLGMKFVAVPGTDILMCAHETRRKDYEAFAASVPGVDQMWRTPAYDGKPLIQTEDHPVIFVSWTDARAFADWLSRKEGKHYRLPTEKEWNLAVVTGLRNPGSASPEDVAKMLENQYPWGTEKLSDADRLGNYRGTQDGHEGTSPVMSFTPNHLGIHDLGGNAWEWCQDLFVLGKDWKVLRGGGFLNFGPPRKSSWRVGAEHDFRQMPKDDFNRRMAGFRLVMEKNAGGRPAPATPATSAFSIPGLPDLPPLTIAAGEPGLVKEIALSADFVRGIHLLPDSRRLLVLRDKQHTLLDLETGKTVWTVQGGGIQTSTALSRDGRRFAHYQFLSAEGRPLTSQKEADEAKISLCETATGQTLQTWKSPVGQINNNDKQIALSPTGETVLARIMVSDKSVGLYPTSRFIALQQGREQPLLTWEAPGHYSQGAHFLSETHAISIGMNIFEMQLTPSDHASFSEAAYPMYGSEISPDRRLLLATHGKSMALWDMQTRLPLRHLEKADLAVTTGSGFAGLSLVLATESVSYHPGTALSQLQIHAWHTTTGRLAASYSQPRANYKFGEHMAGSNSGVFFVTTAKPLPEAGKEANWYLQIFRLPKP